MVEKILEEEYVAIFIDTQELITNTWKNNDTNKESSYLKYWDINNFYGWEMSQTLPVKNFKWFKDISKFAKSFIKSYNEY